MRPRTLALLVLALAAAGCIATDDAPESDVGSQSVENANDTVPEAPTPFTHLVCEDGRLAEMAGDHDEDCNVHVTHDSGPAAEVDVAANPTDPTNLVGGSKDFSLHDGPPCDEHNVWSGVYVSQDSGRTWNHSLLPGHPGDDRETALSDYDCGSDPVIAFGPEGTAYYASIHTSTDHREDATVPVDTFFTGDPPRKNASLAVTRSTDGGRTWEDPVVLLHREDGSILDKEWIAVDPTTGQVYVSYYDTRDGNLEVVRSDDGGESWSDPVTVVPGGGEDDEPAHTHQFAQVGVTPDGTVHLVYWATNEDGDVSGIYHKTSTDDGETWSQPTRVAAYAPLLDPEITHEYRIVPLPDLAIDDADGSIHVAYPSPATNGQPSWAPQNLDIYVASSTDGGESWSDPTRVNDDRIGPQNEQWMSTAEVGPEGTLHVTWLDYRDDPTGQGAYVYYAYSGDEGASFSPNARVSDVPFDGEGGYHQSGTGTIGDYMGLEATEHAVVPFWADTRHGENDVFAAIVPAHAPASERLTEPSH